MNISVLDKRSFFYDKVLGTIPFDLSWIANGFGKGASSEANVVVNESKWMPLHPDGRPEEERSGELLLRIRYNPLTRKPSI